MESAPYTKRTTNFTTGLPVVKVYVDTTDRRGNQRPRQLIQFPVVDDDWETAEGRAAVWISMLEESQ